MRPSRPLVVLVCLAVWSIGSPRLAAQTDVPEPADVYDDTIRRALHEFSLEHWIEAKVLFNEAHALRPNARTLRGLGLACYESRQYVEAITYFEQALNHDVQPLTPEMRDDVQQFLTQSRQFVSRVQLVIQPLEAQLSVDGSQPSPMPADAPLLLNPGPHDVVVSAPGYETSARRVTAEGGNAIYLSIVLKSLQPVAAVAASERAAPAHVAPAAALRAEPSGAELGPWLVVGASGAVAVAGGALLAVAIAGKQRVTSADAPARWADYAGSYDTAKLLFPMGAVMCGVGVVGVAAGLTWRYWPTSTETRSRSALMLQPGYVQLTTEL